MRNEIEALLALGSFPADVDASDDDVAIRAKLLSDVEPPVSDEEAKALLRLLGPDTFYGLSWTLVHLIESAPGWPLWDSLEGAPRMNGSSICDRQPSMLATGPQSIRLTTCGRSASSWRVGRELCVVVDARTSRRLGTAPFPRRK